MLRFTKLENVYQNFSFIAVCLKIRNIISKKGRSKVAGFAASNGKQKYKHSDIDTEENEELNAPWLSGVANLIVEAG